MDTKKMIQEDYLYMQVAGGIEKMIGEEVLKIGDKSLVLAGTNII
jgi:hypothetical protein